MRNRPFHCGIDGIAAALEDIHAHLRCQMLRGNHHAVLFGNRMQQTPPAQG
jgi:hypothetical protein